MVSHLMHLEKCEETIDLASHVRFSLSKSTLILLFHRSILQVSEHLTNIVQSRKIVILLEVKVGRLGVVSPFFGLTDAVV